MDLWNPSAGIRNMKMQPNQTVATPMQADQWVQDERELKRQKRKQSNRESATRSRLRKQDRVCISIDVVLCCISLFWKLLHTDPREACLPASAVQRRGSVAFHGIPNSIHGCSCFDLFLVLLVILFRTFDPKVDSPSTNKVVENDQNLDVEGVNDESHFYDSVDWLMRDEEIDASGNSDDQRTPIPPMPWIHVNSCKLDPQINDATAKITSSDDHRIKRKRRQYRPKVKNIRHATPIPPALPLPRAPSLAQAPAPVQGQKSIFQIMFTKPRKATHIPFVTTIVPPPPPPPSSRSLFPNFFTSRNKIKNIPSSKNSKLPLLPPTGPPTQPEPQRQRYDQHGSICSSSESSCLPPPLPPLNMPEMKDKYYGDFVRLGSYNSNTSSSPDLQPMGQPPTFIKDWMNMTDEAMDASGNSDDQRTPTPPPVPWIHVNYNKPDPQVCDDTNEKSSSDDQSYDTKRKRKSYRLRLRNKRRVTSSIRAVCHARAPAPTRAAPAQALAPAPASTPPPASIFKSMFKKQNKDKRTHLDTAAPTPPPPP
ncbi:G-box-binding factor 1-like protein isoform X1 [Tanacetum coccineum]|uniref:G-box-binding factor 1-like protein isoform X1 n=1 Tax=Tanacetum coccineum TaxID=301880 RepID=A0ABQ5FNV0_9ASTR